MKQISGKQLSIPGLITMALGVLFINISLVTAQISPNIEWEKCLGGYSEDEAQCIQPTADGGYIVGGWTNSNDGDVSGNHGEYDYWLVKINASGGIEWQKCIGGSLNETGFYHLYLKCYVAVTSDGGYIFTGSTNSNNGDVSGNHGEDDVWVVKLDAAGGIQWQNSFGGSSYDYANSVEQTNDGGYIIAGTTASNNGNVTGNHGGTDIWIIKLNSNGALQWQKCLGGSGYDEANSILQLSNGKYMVAGNSYSNDGDVTGHHGDLSKSDIWIAQLDSSGSISWQKSIGDWNNEYGFEIQLTNDGGFIIAGYTSSDNLPGFHGYNDVYVVKTNSSGNVEWDKCFGGSGSSSDGATSIRQTNDGGYILAGRIDGSGGDISGEHGYTDFWIVKINPTGMLEWQKCLGGTGFEEATFIRQTTDNGYIVAGRTSSFNGDVSNNHGGSFDMWVVKLYPQVTGVTDLTETKLHLYPNPVIQNAIVCYELKNDEVISIRLYDNQGKCVDSFLERQHQSTGNYQMVLHFKENLAHGNYLLTLFTEKYSTSISIIK